MYAMVVSNFNEGDAADALRVAERRKNTERRRSNRALQRLRIQQARESTTSSEETIKFLDTTLVHRAASQETKALAFDLYNLIEERGSEWKKTFFKKLLDQPVLQSVLPNFTAQRRDLEQCQVVCDGLAQAWSGLKYGIGRDRKLARNVIEAAVISLEDERCFQAAASVIGMNRRTIRRAKERRSLLNEGIDGELWARLYRKKRKDTLPQEVIDCVQSWWEEETRVSPNKKDVRMKRVGVRQFIEHATQWLEESQASPVHIPAGSNTCNCGCASLCFMPVCSNGAGGPVACQTLFHTYKQSTSLWEKTLCPILEGSEWHALASLKGECNNCGFPKLPICEQELDPSNTSLMHWRRFEQVVAGITKKGEQRTALRLE